MADRKPLVLYVEDDLDLAAVATDVLESEGFETATARDGKQALSLLDQGLSPQVVVTDLMMPKMDGFAFLARYQERPAPRAPVIAVSAFEAYLARAAGAGAASTLQKPFRADALVEAVRALSTGGTPRRPAPRPDPAEDARLEAIHALRLDQPGPSEALQEFTERVSRIFDVPICLVSIVTRDRQYWHCYTGLSGDLASARGTPREDSFCTHAVAARAALVVQDAEQNPFFRENRLVREKGLRFYAGVPVLSRADEALGTLCLLDFAPRGFAYFDLELLGLLARRVAAEIEWRERKASPHDPLSTFRSLEYFDEETGAHGRVAFEEVLLVESLRCEERGLDLAVGIASVPRERIRDAVLAIGGALPRAHVGRIGATRLAVATVGSTPESLGEALATACGPGAHVGATDAGGPGSGRVALARLEAALGR